MPSAFFTWQKERVPATGAIAAMIPRLWSPKATLRRFCIFLAAIGTSLSVHVMQHVTYLAASFTANDAATEARLLKVDVLAFCTARAKIAGSHHLEGSQVVSGGSSAESQAESQRSILMIVFETGR